MMLAEVSGPLVDSYFLGGNLERRQIIATKAVCQVCATAQNSSISADWGTKLPVSDPLAIDGQPWDRSIDRRHLARKARGGAIK
jgi:hypothetical protein